MVTTHQSSRQSTYLPNAHIPTHPATSLPLSTYPATYLPTYKPNYLTTTYLPTLHIATYLPTYLPTYLYIHTYIHSRFVPTEPYPTFTGATGQLALSRFEPWSNHTLIFRTFIYLVNSHFIPFRSLVNSLLDKFAPLLNKGIIASKQSIVI